jgi:hypothetical protein
MRRSPRNLTITWNHAGLAHFGVVYFFHEFLPVLQLSSGRASMNLGKLSRSKSCATSYSCHLANSLGPKIVLHFGSAPVSPLPMIDPLPEKILAKVSKH